MGSLHRLPRLLAALVAVGAAAALATSSASAQAAGTVTGTVQEAGTLRPLANIQVFVPSAGRGTLTNGSGRFVLVNVPAGTVELQVQGVGFATTTETVTVTAGESVEANFTLEASAIALDEVVVTGTGAPTQRRTLGHTIASVDASALEDKALDNVSQVLQGREPGVAAISAGGLTGEGTMIRIRGNSSLSQANDPVVYVDGVRVDIGGEGAGRSSRLDDLNPDAIDRIEILKGAAAATLYGTEASNGVIQIFTKRGQSGDPRWSYGFETGLTEYPAERWNQHAAFARDQEQADYMVEHWGLSSGLQPYEVFEVPYIENLFETGRHNVHSMSVSGGSDNVTYFLSGRMAGENGPFGGDVYRVEGFDLAEDIQKARQANLNLTVLPVERLRVRATGMYIERYNEQPGTGNSTAAPYSMAMMSQPWRAAPNNHSGTSAFQTVREGLQRRGWRDVQRFGGSIGANYEVVDGLTFDGTFGVDIINQQGFSYVPFGYNVDDFTGSYVYGYKSVSDRNRRDVTLDVKSNWTESFGDFSSTFVVGGQLLMQKAQTSGGDGENFPAPGLTVAEAAEIMEVYDRYSASTNAGVFAQEQVGFRDFAFLTVGARYDKHSAFGESTGGALYPKVSLSVIPTDMPGWVRNDLVSSLQIRAALGTSGLQPGAFDKMTTFDPNVSQYGPGLEPDNLGNPNLKPEVSTEWEIGTSAGLFSDRIALDATYWGRTVDDLMINRQFAPSGGFSSRQLDNIGSMKASGVELGLKGTLIQTPNFSVSPFVNASYIWEQITDMGGAPPIKTASTVRYLNWHREGYAPGAFFGPKLMDTEIPITLSGDCTPATREQLLSHFASPRTPQSIALLLEGCGTGAEKDHYLGKPSPDWTGSFGADFSFLENFSFSTQFDYMFGNYSVHNLMGAFRRSHVSLGRNIRSSAEIESTLMNPASTADQRVDAALRWANGVAALSPYDGLNEVEKGDLLRWREANLTYSVPTALVERFGGRSVSMTLAARNLALFTKYTGLDPENNVEGGGRSGTTQFTQGVDSWGLAIPRRLTLSIRVGF